MAHDFVILLKYLEALYHSLDLLAKKFSGDDVLVQRAGGEFDVIKTFLEFSKYFSISS